MKVNRIGNFLYNADRAIASLIWGTSPGNHLKRGRAHIALGTGPAGRMDAKVGQSRTRWAKALAHLVGHDAEDLGLCLPHDEEQSRHADALQT